MTGTRRPTAMAATPGVRDIGCDLAHDLAAETWLPRLAGIDAVVISGPLAFSTYDGRVVSNFIVQALRNEPITLNGDGSQTRSFCYVDDLIEALLRLMATDDSFIGPVNTGNPTEFTIRELAEKVIELTGSRSTLVFAPLPSDDPMQRRPDISLAREKLGWEPTIQLEEGLKRTIAYFDELLASKG